MRLNKTYGTILCAVLLAISGCGTDVSDMNKLNIQKVRNAYSIYSSRHSFRGPKSEQELKDYLKGDKTAQVYLERMGVEIEELDDIFTSERDDEPFTIRWSVNGDGDEPIVFEKTGRDGSRMVSFFKPKEVSDAAEYDKYLSGGFKSEGGAAVLGEAGLEVSPN